MAPLVFAVAVAFGLPESVRFLALRSPDNPRIAEVLGKIGHLPRTGGEWLFTTTQLPATRTTLADLFRDRRAILTALIWLTFFMNLMMVFLLVSWLPSVLRNAGVPLSSAILTTALFSLGGVAGSVVTTAAMDRFGPYRTLAFVFAGAALATSSIGTTVRDATLMMGTVATAGAFVNGAQAGLTALVASLYPTSLRATDTGWALGVGRIGSIIGPLLGGWLIAGGIGAEQLFIACSAPALVSTAAILLLAWHRGRNFAEG